MPRANTAFGTLLVAGLVLVLAWQLAGWTWAFLAPPSGESTRTPASNAVDLAAVARLFGAQAPSTGAATSSTGLRLKGVVAPTPGVAASAIFSTGAGRDLSVFVQGAIQPGVTLAEVHPDHVIVTRAGVRERIDLEAPHALAKAKVPDGRARGFHLDVARSGSNQFSLSRSQLDQALRDPNQLNYLGQIGISPGGGVKMQAAPPGSLAAKLGLQTGDVIREVNGQPVASAGDLARLYQQFATLSQIHAEVQRGTSRVQLSYQIR
jgi:general secretion pathway protein C